MAKKRFSVTIDEEVYKAINDYRWAERLTLNALVAQILKEWIEARKTA